MIDVGDNLGFWALSEDKRRGFDFRIVIHQSISASGEKETANQIEHLSDR